MRVAVAMSGGVDSSVAALLLREQGHDVFGVHMRLHGATRNVTGRCCGVHEALDAAKVAETLGFPLYVIDLREPFEQEVVRPFVESHLRGETPSPCILCNERLKFRELLGRARAAGAHAIATGHYVRLHHGALHTAADAGKDQSYFLFSIGTEALGSALFPLGDLTKPEVRDLAARHGLEVAKKAESQEICFVPDDDHAGFVADRAPELDASGPILDLDGRRIGSHEAYYRFTIGQRRGLGVALGRPAYVVALHPEERAVVVGPDHALLGGGLVFRDPVWYRGFSGGACLARIRHRGELLPAWVEGDQVRFTQSPARAVTPGQAVVFYGDDTPRGRPVLGGAWIRRG